VTGSPGTPEDRDAVLAQRTKDLAGLMGQVRGFDLDAFLSNWEQTRYAEPWAPCVRLTAEAGVRSGVPSTAPSQALNALAQQAGMSRQLKVLYLMDYTGWILKESMSSRLSMELRKLLPHFEVDYAVAEGPYEDDNGDGAYFAAGKQQAQWE
jgi:hypothetical protein